MPEDFVIARNPEPDTSLPYLLRIPTPGAPILLKSRETWPRTSKVYCHRAAVWPEEPEIVERVPVRRCVKRGAAIELVLDRGRRVGPNSCSHTSGVAGRRSSGRRRGPRSRHVRGRRFRGHVRAV